MMRKSTEEEDEEIGGVKDENIFFKRAGSNEERFADLYCLFPMIFLFISPGSTNVHAEKIEPNDKRETWLLSEYNDSFF